jgi:hypothetical protein
MEKDKLIFKALVGSHAYGTNIETSDYDYKGIYQQPLKQVIGFKYKPQVEVGKDECYYEIKRFLELAQTANPTILEMMWMPKENIMINSSKMARVLCYKHQFLSKQCLNSFGGYAVAQIKKAKGLDKKMNWEKERVERKELADFCYISKEGKSVSLRKYLKDNELREEFIGMVKLDHMADCYAMYHDAVAQWGADANHRGKKENEVPSLGFKGLSSEDGNHLLLSSIPKYTIPKEGFVYFNKSEYNRHLAEMKSYETWLKEHNTARYTDTLVHGQKIDGKNLMHCRRLLDQAAEIAKYGKLVVRRPNADQLLYIRRGMVKLDEVIARAEDDILELNELYAKCDLPDTVNQGLVESLLLEIRGL